MDTDDAETENIQMIDHQTQMIKQEIQMIDQQTQMTD